MARSEIQFDHTGVRLVRRPWFGRPVSTGAAWSDVVGVEARRDTNGPAELVFHGGDGPMLTAAADQRGFDALRTALPALLARADEAWWPALAAEPGLQRRYLVWERG